MNFKIHQIDINLESSDDLTEKIINATTKRCPNCGFRESHFHGHDCHHVKKGCANCKTEYCWSCSSTAEDNLILRGSKSSCRCPSGFWSTFCKNEHILENIILNEYDYPIDKRCGCPICNQCLKGKPCGDLCRGQCVVCKGLIAQGPTELNNKISVSIIERDRLMREKDRLMREKESDVDREIIAMETMLFRMIQNRDIIRREEMRIQQNRNYGIDELRESMGRSILRDRENAEIQNLQAEIQRRRTEIQRQARLERDRIQREQYERERPIRERLIRERNERLERERLERERIERIERERIERVERERLEIERIERERINRVREQLYNKIKDTFGIFSSLL